MGALSFDLLCSSAILISPINCKVELTVIYQALVRFVLIINLSSPFATFFEGTLLSSDIKIIYSVSLMYFLRNVFCEGYQKICAGRAKPLTGGTNLFLYQC